MADPMGRDSESEPEPLRNELSGRPPRQHTPLSRTSRHTQDNRHGNPLETHRSLLDYSIINSGRLASSCFGNTWFRRGVG